MLLKGGRNIAALYQRNEQQAKLGIPPHWSSYVTVEDAELALASALDAFACATFRDPMESYVQRMLWALEADGVVPQGACDPFGAEISELERTAVYDAVRALRQR